MDDPNITMEEYIRLEEEKARRRGKVYNWETAKYGKIWDDEDVHDLRSVETEFPAIVFDDAFTSEVTPSYEPTVSPLNENKIDFRISFDESDDEDYTVIYDKNSFSYKIISVDDLKTDSENDNDKVNMPSFPSPEPTVSYFDDLDFFKDFENEFPAIVYNDALTSKSDFLTEPTVSPQHIDEFNLKDETSLSECDEEEQNVLYFNDLFPFNVIYPDDSKSDKDNDDDKIDIEHSSGDLSIKLLPATIYTAYPNPMDTAYDLLDVIQSLFSAQSIRGPRERKSMNVGGKFTNLEILKCWSLETSRRLELKDESLRNKAIMEGLISDDESCNDCWKKRKSHEIYYHNYDKGEYVNETHEEGHEVCSIKTHEVPICQIKRYKMIKYSLNNEEEYVAVKEDEYDDLTITSEEPCRVYQEIFQMMDEGWMVTRT
ncbi:hypothetical protein Tco_0223227 [Tanacetum coccineum]